MGYDEREIQEYWNRVDDAQAAYEKDFYDRLDKENEQAKLDRMNRSTYSYSSEPKTLLEWCIGNWVLAIFLVVTLGPIIIGIVSGILAIIIYLVILIITKIAKIGIVILLGIGILAIISIVVTTIIKSCHNKKADNILHDDILK